MLLRCHFALALDEHGMQCDSALRCVGGVVCQMISEKVVVTFVGCLVAAW